MTDPRPPVPVLLLLVVAVLGVLLLPPPTPGQAGVRQTASFTRWSWFADLVGEPLYPHLDEVPARGSQGWVVTGSVSMFVVLDGTQEPSITLQPAGSVQLDPANPESARGELELEGGSGALTGAWAAAGGPATLRIQGLDVGDLPRLPDVVANGDVSWVLSVGGRTLPLHGPVQVTRAGEDAFAVRHANRLTSSLETPQGAILRRVFVDALGGGAVGEELSVELSLNLAR